MVGWIIYEEQRRKRGELSPVLLSGCMMMKGTVPGKRLLGGRLEAARIAGGMRKRGVRTAIYPESFPYEDIFWKAGIMPYPILPLYQAMTPQMLRWEMNALGISPANATVAIVGDALTRAAEHMICELCLQIRYLIVQLKGQEAPLCDTLRREYGVSILQTPTRSQLLKADAIIELSPQERAGEKPPILLRIYDGDCVLHQNHFAFSLPGGLSKEVSENTCTEQLLSYLMEEGVLKPYQIPLKWLTFEQKNNIMLSLCNG